MGTEAASCIARARAALQTLLARIVSTRRSSTFLSLVLDDSRREAEDHGDDQSSPSRCVALGRWEAYWSLRSCGAYRRPAFVRGLSPIQLISDFPRAARGNGSPIQLVSVFPRAARGNLSPIQLISEFPRAARGNGSPIQLISEFPRAARGNGSPIQLISEFPRAARGK